MSRFSTKDSRKLPNVNSNEDLQSAYFSSLTTRIANLSIHEQENDGREQFHLDPATSESTVQSATSIFNQSSPEPTIASNEFNRLILGIGMVNGSAQSLEYGVETKEIPPEYSSPIDVSIIAQKDADSDTESIASYGAEVFDSEGSEVLEGGVAVDFIGKTADPSNVISDVFIEDVAVVYDKITEQNLTTASHSTQTNVEDNDEFITSHLHRPIHEKHERCRFMGTDASTTSNFGSCQCHQRKCKRILPIALEIPHSMDPDSVNNLLRHQLNLIQNYIAWNRVKLESQIHVATPMSSVSR